MIRTKMTGRVIRMLAIVALAATPVVVLTTASPAGAVTPVTNQDDLRDQFENPSVTEIVLGADITIDSSGDEGCDQLYRNEDTNALVIDGQGHTITKDEADCADDWQEGERIFRQRGEAAITFKNVTVTGGVKIGGEGGAIKSDGPVSVIDSNFNNNQALECNQDKSEASSTDVEAENYCGDPDGGAIFAEGAVTVTNSTFANNFAERSGGAVVTEGNITVTNSTFTGNSVENWSRCFCSGGAFVAWGGADITNSEITGNSATCDHYCGAEGGGFWSANSTSVVNSIVSGNTASCSYGCSGKGGGFSGSGYSEFSMAAATAGELGVAAADPGAIEVKNSVISGNVASCAFDYGYLESLGGNDVCGAGGGFSVEAADSILVDHSTISGNQALCTIDVEAVQAAGGSEICGGGGGFYFDDVSEVNVNASTLSGNVATIFGSALANFPAIASGAICDACGGTDVTLTNSTVTGNTAGELGTIWVYSNQYDTLNLVHDTIVKNTTDFNLILPIIGTTAQAEEDDSFPVQIWAVNLTSFGSIVAQPQLVIPEGVLTALADPVASNCVTEATDSQGYNFTDDDSCGFDQSTDIVATPNDPMLEPLGNYGGPTQTMRPVGEIDGATGLIVSLSPVVDKIPAGGKACPNVPTDQRGITRPQFVIANACDIGAVEITAAEITVSPADVVRVTPRFTG